MLFQLVSWSAVWAATLQVGPDKAYPNIDRALTDAVDGDLILVDPGTYVDRLLIKADVTIRSTDGPESTIIADGDDWQLSVVKIWNDATLDGFTFTTFDDDWRHCVRVAPGGTLVLTNSIFTGCTAGDGLGGGLRFDVDTTGVVTDTRFVDNEALEKIAGIAAHIYSRADALTIRRCAFIDGFAENGDGGAIYANSGTVTIEESRFLRNVAGDDGGAIAVDGEAQVNPDGTESDGVSSIILRSNTFEDSEAGGSGGVAFIRDVPNVDIRGNTLCSSSAGFRGGAMYFENSLGTVTNNVLIDQSAGERGGAISLKYESPVIENNHILGSDAVDAGSGVFAYDVPNLVLRNDLFAWTKTVAAVFANGGTIGPVNEHNGFHENDAGDYDGLVAGPGDVFADPELRDWKDNGLCRDDDLRPQVSSPLVDAGAPSLLDTDGSASDIGAFGGEGADPCVGAPYPLPAACLPDEPGPQ